MVLLGIAVAEAVPTVGALLIFALLIAPAAIAQRLVKRPYMALLLAALLALVFTWAGLLIAFYLPYPVSFVISALAFALYLGIIAVQRLVAHQRDARTSRQPAG
jgi:zinc/manganese transport system permease protein